MAKAAAMTTSDARNCPYPLLYLQACGLLGTVLCGAWPGYAQRGLLDVFCRHSEDHTNLTWHLYGIWQGWCPGCLCGLCLDLRQGQVLYPCCLQLAGVVCTFFFSPDVAGLDLHEGGRHWLKSLEKVWYPAHCQIACCCHHACMSLHMPCVPQACLLLLFWVLRQTDTLSYGGRKQL